MTPERLVAHLKTMSVDEQAKFLDGVVGRLTAGLRDALLSRWLPSLCLSLDGERAICDERHALVGFLTPTPRLTREEAAKIVLPRVERTTALAVVTSG